MTVPESNMCAFCGLTLGGSTASNLCPHHHMVGDDWAIQNRIWCGAIHRGEWPERLPKDQREDDASFWAEVNDPGMAA